MIPYNCPVASREVIVNAGRIQVAIKINGFGGHIASSTIADEFPNATGQDKAFIEGIERLLLSLACEGVDVGSSSVGSAVYSAIECYCNA